MQTTGIGEVAGQPVEFLPAHRDGNDTPVALQVTMTVPLSLEDVEAVLWIVLNGGMTFDELADEGYVRSLVAETLSAEGGLRLDDARWSMADALAERGTPAAAMARQIRRRVRQVFAPVPAQRRRPALVGVAG